MGRFFLAYFRGLLPLVGGEMWLRGRKRKGGGHLGSKDESRLASPRDPAVWQWCLQSTEIPLRHPHQRKWYSMPAFNFFVFACQAKFKRSFTAPFFGMQRRQKGTGKQHCSLKSNRGGIALKKNWFSGAHGWYSNLRASDNADCQWIQDGPKEIFLYAASD